MADKPFPRSEAEIYAFLQNLNEKLPAIGAFLGLDATDLNNLAYYTTNWHYLMTVSTQVNDSRDSFFEFKNDVMYGEPGKVAAFGGFPSISTPETANTGIVPWTRQLVKRIKVSSGYTPTIGEALGFIVNNGDQLNPNDVVPTLKLRAANEGVVEITFSKQGFDAMRVDFKRKGDENWQLAGVYVSSPGIHSIPPIEPGTPEAREYRGILLKKNQPVTQYSTSSNIVTNPTS
jgi:hypothetical protein